MRHLTALLQVHDLDTAIALPRVIVRARGRRPLLTVTDDGDAIGLHALRDEIVHGRLRAAARLTWPRASRRDGRARPAYDPAMMVALVLLIYYLLRRWL